jgi:PhoH-like ATPase
MITKSSTGKKSSLVYVLDTNVFLIDSNAISAFRGHEIVLPITVLEELDKAKNYDNVTGLNARRTARELKRLFKKGNPASPKGIPLSGGGKLKIKTECDVDKLPTTLDKYKNDNKVLLTAYLLKKSTKSKKIILVTNDIVMSLKAASLEIETEEYESPKKKEAKKDDSIGYTGLKTLVVKDEIVEAINNDKPTIIPNSFKVKANQFLILRSNIQNKKTALVRYNGKGKPLRKIFTSKQVSFYGIAPKNTEQRLYIDLLTDPNIELVTVNGKAGTGKTLLSISTALHLVLDKQMYSRIVILRPTVPFGGEIGFLPGLKLEKLWDWHAPVWDNLRETMGSYKRTKTIYGNNKISEEINHLIDTGKLEVEALTYIKGRSLNNAFIIVDEAEDLTEKEIKMICTRAGYNSKIVLTGDITQIDNPHINEYECGMSKLITKMCDEPTIGHITLSKSERSPLAGLIADRL